MITSVWSRSRPHDEQAQKLYPPANLLVPIPMSQSGLLPGSRPSAQDLILCFLQPRFRIDSEFAKICRKCDGCEGHFKSSVRYTVSGRRSIDVNPSTRTAAV
jgi:hypothetical protein